MGQRTYNEHGLNRRQELFCHEFLKDLNATKAAQRSGYSKKTCPATGAENLHKPKIKARIQALMEKRQEKVEVDSDRVVQRLANIAFGHIGLVCTWTDKGLDLIEKSELSEESLSIILEIHSKPILDPKGKPIAHECKVRMKDSLKALEMLSKHLGLLDGKSQSSKNTSHVKDKLSKLLESLSSGK